MALTCQGQVYVWGRGIDGQLGHGIEITKEPEPSRGGRFRPEPLPWVGDYHSFAVEKDGKVRGWGSNRSGQAGVDFDAKGLYAVCTPTLVSSLHPDNHGGHKGCADCGWVGPLPVPFLKWRTLVLGQV